MLELKFAYKPVNTKQLEDELREVFQKRYGGYSTNGTESIVFYLNEPIEKSDEEVLTAIYNAHTPEETDEKVREKLDLQVKQAYQLINEFDPEALKQSSKSVDAIVDLLAAFRTLLLGR